MYTLDLATSARKSLKKLQRNGKFDKKLFDSVVRTLCSGHELGAKFKDHQLKGPLSTYRECHLGFDLLVVYEIDHTLRMVTIAKIGTHDELFG